MRVLLMTAPYADYTYPYHSLAYLVPELARRGYAVDVIDLSAEWFRACFDERWLCEAKRELTDELGELEGQPALSIAQQSRFVQLVQGLSICDSVRPELALEVLRGEAFYDYSKYRVAQDSVRRFERLLDCVHAPGQFHTAFAQPPFNANAARLVEMALSCRRFGAEIARLLQARLARRDYLFCGVSVPFEAQLLLGLAVQAAVAQVLPGTRRAMGGTAISDLVKNAQPTSCLRAFARCCEDFLVGECDVAVGDYADYCAGKRATPPDRMIALNRVGLSVSRDYDHLRLRSRHLSPEYSWIDWSLYLSPERHVNYSPARGCFWNKCTFCDYGFNDDLPAAPYRRTSAAQVADDLGVLREQGIRSVYFAVDSLDPAFLRDVAHELLTRQLHVSWSTELFLNEKFDQALVSLLDRAGLITASFGLESGSDRILEKMGKGRERNARVHEPVFRAFRSSRIGLQPKYFFGFPGETDEDREATLRLLSRHADVFSVLTRANLFDLTAGSIVAKNPRDFGIRDIQRRSPDDDIGGALVFQQDPPAQTLTPRRLRAFNGRISYPSEFERPWAGGIDTFHTKLYVERYGKGVFHELGRRIGRGEFAELWHETRVVSAFDVEAAFENVLLSDAASSACLREEAHLVMGADALRVALEEVIRPLARSSRRSGYAIRLR